MTLWGLFDRLSSSCAPDVKIMVKGGEPKLWWSEVNRAVILATSKPTDDAEEMAK